MTETSSLSALVTQRYGVALAVSRELRVLHERLRDELGRRIAEHPAWEQFSAATIEAGGTATPWSSRGSQTPVHVSWAGAYRRETEEWLAGTRIDIEDHLGALCLRPTIWMNLRIVKFEGKRFREAWSDLPSPREGDWESGGSVGALIPLREGNIDELIAHAVDATATNFPYAGRLFRAIVAELKRA